MKRRKEYHTLTRLRRSVTGASISFDGYEENYQKARLASGIPLNGELLNYMLKFPFVWRIDLTLIFASTTVSDLGKSVIIDGLQTDQAVKLNDLSEIITEHQIEAALELGDNWQFVRKEWKATIIK